MTTFPAYLGWGNPDRDNASVRLYATDLEPPTAPRWDRRSKGGRVVEYALTETYGSAEGDRFVVVRIGDRFTTAEQMEVARRAISAALADCNVNEHGNVIDYGPQFGEDDDVPSDDGSVAP